MQRQSALDDTELVRVLGYFALIVAVACLFLFAANTRSRYLFGANDLSYLAYIAVYALVGGWGMARLRKWGAVMLAVPLCIGGLVLAALSIWKDHSVVGLVVASSWIAILWLPALFAFRAWRSLK